MIKVLKNAVRPIRTLAAYVNRGGVIREFDFSKVPDASSIMKRFLSLDFSRVPLSEKRWNEFDALLRRLSNYDCFSNNHACEIARIFLGESYEEPHELYECMGAMYNPTLNPSNVGFELEDEQRLVKIRLAEVVKGSCSMGLEILWGDGSERVLTKLGKSILQRGWKGAEAYRELSRQ